MAQPARRGLPLHGAQARGSILCRACAASVRGHAADPMGRHAFCYDCRAARTVHGATMKLRERAALLRGVALLLECELSRIDAERAQPPVLLSERPDAPGGKDLAAERERVLRAWQDLSAAADRAERKLSNRCGDDCD